MSEDYIVRHAAPTLAGIKTGNLFLCTAPDRVQFNAELRHYNRMLRPKGLRLLPLRSDGEQRILLYLYRPRHLNRDLASAGAREILRQMGYEDLRGERCLGELIRRLRTRPDFPHEIGLFLSYPPEDVQGFILHRGKNSKCSGMWKVYGDVQKAQTLFRRYKQCTANYCRQCADGIPMAALAVEG